MADVEQRVCLVTGASGTLGSAFCRLYGSKYAIAAVYRNNAPQATSQYQRYVDPLRPGASLPENAHPLFIIRADLQLDAELDRVVELVLTRFGRVDILVNTAVQYAFGSIVESKTLLGTLEEQFNVNALVPVKLAARVARAFWRTRDIENRRLGRNVVNVSSVSASQVTAGRGYSAYSAAKAALNAFTLHMASEFRDFGVRANVCAPASFPQVVSAERVAESIRQLDCGRMSGTVLVVGRNPQRIANEKAQLDHHQRSLRRLSISTGR